MRKFIVHVLLAWSHLCMYVDGARQEHMAIWKGEATALRQKGHTVAQVRMRMENDGHVDSAGTAKVSLWQDPYIPVHSVNEMSTTVPGHRPRAFVVAVILVVLLMMLFVAIFNSIYRKVAEDLTPPPRQGFGGLLGHSLSPHPIPYHGLHRSGFAKDVATLRANAPGDLRRVNDEIAEVSKDLTPPHVANREASESRQKGPELLKDTRTPSEAASPSENFTYAPVTPSKRSEREHPALGDAPLPTPPPRSPPKRRKHAQSGDVADQATPQKPDATVPAVVPPEDMRNLDDEFAELTKDLVGATASTPQMFQQFTARDFAEVKTLRAVCADLRSRDDELIDLGQDLLPPLNSSGMVGELRRVQDEMSDLTHDLQIEEQMGV